MKVKEVIDLGPLFSDNDKNIIGQDGSYTIPLKENILWFFGDTLIGKRIPGESLWYPGGVKLGPESMDGVGGVEKMLTNTAILMPHPNDERKFENFEIITNSKDQIKQLVPLAENEDHDKYRIWCLHGVELDNKVYLFYQKVEMLAEECVLPVNFKIVGSGLSMGNSNEWDFKRLSKEGENIIWDETRPQFASAVLNNTEEDGYLYFYGVMKNPVGIQQCYIARVEPGQIENFNEYDYLLSDNAEWGKDVSFARPIFDGMPNELSVSFNKHLNCYLAVHSLDLTGLVVARTSKTPWGPWSEYTELFKVNAKREIDLPYPVLIYAGKEHPALAEENGKVLYITYVEFEEYKPHLMKIILE